MDRLARCELHVRGQPRLRRHLDWRQLFVVSLRFLLWAHQWLRAHREGGDGFPL